MISLFFILHRKKKIMANNDKDKTIDTTAEAVGEEAPKEAEATEANGDGNSDAEGEEYSADGKYTDVFTAMVKHVEDNKSSIIAWSDDKKKDFVGLFKKRANASIYILRNTAKSIANTALKKQFLGQPRFNKLTEELNHFAGDDQLGFQQPNQAYYRDDDSRRKVWADTYDRTQHDLDEVVATRSKDIVKQLPSMVKAMEILDPETAKDIIKRDELKKKGQEIVDKFNETSVEIRLSDMPQDMTIGEFRQHVKDLEATRKGYMDELEEISKEGQELERRINKALFKGIPGISDEIEEVCKDVYERSKALGVLIRRIEEQVLYGDSETAVTLLSSFDKDERELRGDIQERFRKGLERLKLVKAKKEKKALKSKPKAKPATK